MGRWVVWEELLSGGIPSDHIISMRYTSENFNNGMTSKQMYQGIKEKMTDDARYYLLLDEVQEVDGWKKTLSFIAVKDMICRESRY